MHSLKLSLTLSILLLISPLAKAEVCGLYQMEDYGFDVLYTISDLDAGVREQINYSIANPDALLVKRMVMGACYCVLGETSIDPFFKGDPRFLKIEISKVISGPYYDCDPVDWED